MMGRSHALSGAAAWLAGCTVTSPSPFVTVLGAVACAGAALLPDLDHPRSTIAYAFGPASRALACVTATASQKVHEATRTRLDRPDLDGHRTLTHTGVFALAVGLAVATAGSVLGPATAAGVLFLTTGLTLRGLAGSWCRRQGWLVITALSTILAATAWWTVTNAWWLGVAVTAGCLAHCAGDALTHSGCPILWPLRIRGKRWWPVAPPKAWRMGTDGVVERWLVYPGLLAASGVCGWLLAAQTIPTT